MPLKIKEEHKGTIIGFNNSGTPLGERDDLFMLAESISRNPGNKKYFDEVPTSDEITRMHADYFEKKQSKKRKPATAAVVASKAPSVVTQSTGDASKNPEAGK